MAGKKLKDYSVLGLSDVVVFTGANEVVSAYDKKTGEKLDYSLDWDLLSDLLAYIGIEVRDAGEKTAPDAATLAEAEAELA